MNANRVFGRVISDKVVKNSVVRSVLKAAWERFGKVTMTEMDDRMLAFDFENNRDRDTYP